MKIHTAYVPQGGVWPFQGIDADSPSNLASPRSSPSASNVDFLRGYLAKRRGYTQLGNQITHNTVAQTGALLAVAEFSPSFGNYVTVAFDTKKQFKFNTTTGNWDDLTPSPDWTGDEDDGIQWIVGTDSSGRYIYATNGVDLPRRWDGSNPTFQDMPHNIPNFVTCKTFAVYGSSLILGNITTTANEPQVVYWSDTGNFSEFLTGNSGFALLPDVKGDIMRLETLGDRLAIYCEDSISVVTFVGGVAVFAFETLVSDTRLLSGRAVCDAGLLHFFMGRENIFAFDGTRAVRPIGDAIRPLYRRLIDLSQANRAFAFNDFNENRAWFVTPTGPDSSVVFTYEYDKTNPLSGRWAMAQFAHRCTSLGYYRRSGSLTWAELVPDWENWAGNWNSIESRASFPAMAMGSLGFVYLLDGTSFSDAGMAVDAFWESVDFLLPSDWPGGRGRWQQVEIEARGSSMLVQFSLDRGRTWSTGQTFALTVDPAIYRMYIDGVSDVCRVRLSASGADHFVVHALRVGVRYAGIA